MDRRLAVLATLVVLAGVAACGRGPATRTGPAGDRAAFDWDALDRQGSRHGWAAKRHELRGGWTGPAETFLPTIAFDAPRDSLGAEEFAARPDAERAWRRAAAAELVAEVVVGVGDRAGRLRDRRIAPGFDFKFAEVLPRALRGLHTAVGTDPASAGAWYHLAYFSAVIGDRETAARARGAHLALTIAAANDADPVRATRRCRLVLDQAWDLRDEGRFADCLAWLDGHAGELAAAATGEFGLPPAVEADLLRALCHAERGELLPARRYQARLPALDLQIPGATRRERPADDLRTWVHAWLDLRTGNLDLASWRLGYRQFGRRPAAIAWRFWQDMGLIAAELGDHDLATRSWLLAYWEHPYKMLFPQTVHRPAAEALTEPDADHPYVQAFRTFFLAGSPWSFAVTRALACQQAGPDERPLLWRQAVGSLGACIRRGFQPQAARLLRARLLLIEGDWAAAAADLEAIRLSDLAGSPRAPDHAFLRGVAELGAGRLDESRTWFERCLEHDPQHARAWQALAVALAYEGRDEEALAAFDRVDQLLPDDGPNRFNRGLLHLQRGDRAAALRDLERAAILMPGNDRVVTLLQTVASGREVTVDLTPQPVQLVAGATEVRRGAALFRLAGDGDGAGPGDLALALSADRELGDPARALAIAAGEVPAAELDEATLLLAIVILLDHGHVAQAHACRELARSHAGGDAWLDSLLADIFARHANDDPQEHTK